jgi:hypothetical protein
VRSHCSMPSCMILKLKSSSLGTWIATRTSSYSSSFRLGFKIDTPIGTYNPDWAFVTEREQKLYFVRETKGSLDSEERRSKENQKIACGRKHFDSLGVDYGVVTSLSEVAM